MERWEKQEQTRSLLPTKGELVETVTPPITPKEKRRPNYLLWMQILICVLVVGVLLVAKKRGCKFYQECKASFDTVMQKETTLPDGQELLRFVSAKITKKTQKECEENMQKYIGAGGKKPAKWPRTPQGYSEEVFEPSFKMQLPICNFEITSPYGWRRHPFNGKEDFHTGLDMATMEGNPIFPVADGIVVKAVRGPSYGNNVIVLHKDGTATRYCHMQYIFVRPGEPVKTESQLGTVGCTGVATGPHLHLELLKDDIGYDPAPALGLK